MESSPSHFNQINYVLILWSPLVETWDVQHHKGHDRQLHWCEQDCRAHVGLHPEVGEMLLRFCDLLPQDDRRATDLKTSVFCRTYGQPFGCEVNKCISFLSRQQFEAKEEYFIIISRFALLHIFRLKVLLLTWHFLCHLTLSSVILS